jgi:phosphoglycolate phosphatase-like HAD superfamily hydrolase
MRYDAILFDLDDTLIDTKKRHYTVVSDFINNYGKSLVFEDYLKIRKEKNWTNGQVIKNLFSLNESDFYLFWKSNIENPAYLQYDVEIVNSDLLSEFKAKYLIKFILISLRSNSKSAIEQFRKFQFSSLFDESYFLRHADLNPKIEKVNYCKQFYRHLTFISDSQDDCRAAQVNGIEFIGVQSGINQLKCEKQFIDINSYLLNQRNEY